MIKFENVKDQTTEEYFNNNKFSIDAFNKKYIAYHGETYTQAIKRVCDYMASAEDTKELQTYWSERWFDEIYNDWWHPGGSIMQGAASDKKISMFNCTTISMGANLEHQEWDNLESIIKNTAYTIAKCAAYRQGSGIHYGRLRPVGTKVLNSANQSTGSIHWMKFHDNISYYVGQLGRIPALLISQDCSHPDIIDFIKCKSDTHSIQNANLSVHCTDAFYRAVENNDDWELTFEIPEVMRGQKVYIDEHSKDMDSKYDEQSKQWYYIAKKDRPHEKVSKIVKASFILELIAKGMFGYGEPGIQNIDTARKYSNSDYVYDECEELDSRIISSNACCITKDSLISTNRGKLTLLEISDIIKEPHNNLMAMSYNIKDNTWEMKPILNIWQQRNDTTVELTIEENGTIFKLECSSDHQIYTINRGYIPANSLTENDDIKLFN